MARRKELFAAGIPCYVVQRGAGGLPSFRNSPDYIHCLAALREAAAPAGLRVLGYCLLPDCMHMVAVPDRPDSLHAALNPLLPRIHRSPLLDDASVWRTVAQVELAPVPEGLVSRAISWRWSSAAAHTGYRSADPLLDMDEWSKHWSRSSWSAELDLLELSLAAPPPFPLKENGISPAWPPSLRTPVIASS